MTNNARRRYSRFKKDMTVVIHEPYVENRVGVADISLSAAALYNIERYYNAEQILHIEIITTDMGSIYCNASIVSIHPNYKGASTYRINIQFTDMSDADKDKLKKCI